MSDSKSPLSLSPMGGRDRDRELLIPVSGGGSAPGDGDEDGDRASSSSASAALSSSGREVGPLPAPPSLPPSLVPTRFHISPLWFDCYSANLMSPVNDSCCSRRFTTISLVDCG